MKTDPRVGAYIAKSAAFAQPILRHLRKLVHAGCPDVEETIKWSMPSFTAYGSILCGFAAFKEHCVFGFWHQGMEKVIGGESGKGEQAMGHMGRIRHLKDLPSDRALLGYVREAAKLNASGAPARPKKKLRKALPVPPDLTAALKQNAAAKIVFSNFSPSQQREYIEWITEAKREATRASRLATAVGWIAEGKRRNWKYEKC